MRKSDLDILRPPYGRHVVEMLTKFQAESPNALWCESLHYDEKLGAYPPRRSKKNPALVALVVTPAYLMCPICGYRMEDIMVRIARRRLTWGNYAPLLRWPNGQITPNPEYEN